jgi:hypothetical protein
MMLAQISYKISNQTQGGRYETSSWLKHMFWLLIQDMSGVRSLLLTLKCITPVARGSEPRLRLRFSSISELINLRVTATFPSIQK